MSGISRSVARPLARPISSPVSGGGGGGPVVPSFDPDAADYFSRVATLGGSFDQSALNATYTETYVKSAINDFVVGCKADDVWSKLTEIYLMAGCSFAGLMAKLKYLSVPTLTNYNFVTGDYLAAGSGGGLKGDGSTKYLDTGIAPTAFATLGSGSHGYYCTQAGTGDNIYGSFVSQAERMSFDRLSAGALRSALYSAQSGLGSIQAPTAITTGMIVGGCASGALKIYANGGELASKASGAGTVPSTDYALFKLNGIAGYYCNYRDTFSFLGQGLSPTQVASLSSRVNALMTALGSNVY